MRILIATTNFLPKIDGLIRVVYDHARKLAVKGHHVYLVTERYKDAPSDEIIEGINITRTSSPNNSRSKFLNTINRIINFRKEISKIIESHRHIDVMYAFGLISGISCLDVKIMNRIPMVLSFHHSSKLDSLDKKFTQENIGLSKVIITLLARSSNATVFPTKFAKILAENMYGNFQNSVVVPNGVDIEKFSNKYHSNNMKPTILYAGVLRRRKGLDVLIEALGRVRKVFPSVELVLVGKGGDESRLKLLADKYQMNETIKFMGGVGERELLMHYAEASIFVSPTYFDTYPTSILEAMAMGKPIVTTYGSATEDVILNGENGILVNPGDKEGLALAITRLLERPDVAKKWDGEVDR